MTSEKRKEYHRKWRQENKERIKNKNREWYQNNRNRHLETSKKWHQANRNRVNIIRNRWRDSHPDRQLLHNAKMRARVLKLPFNLTIDDIFIPEFCLVLGMKLNWTRGRGRTQPDCPSLDRLRPELGYVKENVQVISWRANWLKRDGTLEEFERVVSYLRTMIGKSSQMRTQISGARAIL